MDKNTIIGLGLIGVILAGFTFFSQPSEEELAERARIEKAYIDSVNTAQAEIDAVKAEAKDLKTATSNNLIAKKIENENGEMVAALDANNNPIFTDTITKQDTVLVTKVETPSKPAEEIVLGETTVLQNDKIKVELSTKGGKVASVYLKDYESYDNFAKEDDKIEALCLFDEANSVNQLVFDYGGNTYRTGNKSFEIVKKTNTSATMRLTVAAGKTIDFVYTLNGNEYDLAYDIKLNGFTGNDITAQNVKLNWETQLLKSERLLSEQRRISTVFYKEKNEGYSYLSEMSEDDSDVEKTVDWLAFKQSYFSSIMMPANGFAKAGTHFYINKFEEGTAEDTTYIKKYKAFANLGLSSVDGGMAQIKWYFGPNDYDILKKYGNDQEDIINLGWGLFRWVNIYAIQPIFNFLASTGINLGIAILLLTIIVKGFLTPIQWKMYTSSAKMRILKPEIEEITKKYPNKEDAMKKQMETMTLYRESGASPLSGCVPMLIQMPILFAVFRFFPSTFTLRQQSFLWAEDLSSYDSIYDLPFTVPLNYGDHISLFTLLMAITTVIYTAINSGNMQQPTQQGMPNMKYIMYFFPVMMIFFFNNYASGLSYYYFISTLMSILTMLMIKKFFVDEDKLRAKMAAKKASKANGGNGKAKGKSKFQTRLEQMQKMQQEKSKK